MAWVTPKVNNEHARRLGLMVSVRGEAHPRAKLTEADVLAIRADPADGRTVARRLGVSDRLVTAIRRREIWKHV